MRVLLSASLLVAMIQLSAVGFPIDNLSTRLSESPQLKEIEGSLLSSEDDIRQRRSHGHEHLLGKLGLKRKKIRRPNHGRDIFRIVYKPEGTGSFVVYKRKNSPIRNTYRFQINENSALEKQSFKYSVGDQLFQFHINPQNKVPERTSAKGYTRGNSTAGPKGSDVIKISSTVEVELPNLVKQKKNKENIVLKCNFSVNENDFQKNVTVAPNSKNDLSQKATISPQDESVIAKFKIQNVVEIGSNTIDSRKKDQTKEEQDYFVKENASVVTESGSDIQRNEATVSAFYDKTPTTITRDEGNQSRDEYGSARERTEILYDAGELSKDRTFTTETADQRLYEEYITEEMYVGEKEVIEVDFPDIAAKEQKEDELLTGPKMESPVLFKEETLNLEEKRSDIDEVTNKETEDKVLFSEEGKIIDEDKNEAEGDAKKVDVVFESEYETWEKGYENEKEKNASLRKEDIENEKLNEVKGLEMKKNPDFPLQEKNLEDITEDSQLKKVIEGTSSGQSALIGNKPKEAFLKSLDEIRSNNPLSMADYEVQETTTMKFNVIGDDVLPRKEYDEQIEPVLHAWTTIDMLKKANQALNSESSDTPLSQEKPQKEDFEAEGKTFPLYFNEPSIATEQAAAEAFAAESPQTTAIAESNQHEADGGVAIASSQAQLAFHFWNSKRPGNLTEYEVYEKVEDDDNSPKIIDVKKVWENEKEEERHQSTTVSTDESYPGEKIVVSFENSKGAASKKIDEELDFDFKSVEGLTTEVQLSMSFEEEPQEGLESFTTENEARDDEEKNGNADIESKRDRKLHHSLDLHNMKMTESFLNHDNNIALEKFPQHFISSNSIGNAAKIEPGKTSNLNYIDPSDEESLYLTNHMDYEELDLQISNGGPNKVTTAFPEEGSLPNVNLFSPKKSTGRPILQSTNANKIMDILFNGKAQRSGEEEKTVDSEVAVTTPDLWNWNGVKAVPSSTSVATTLPSKNNRVDWHVKHFEGDPSHLSSLSQTAIVSFPDQRRSDILITDLMEDYKDDVKSTNDDLVSVDQKETEDSMSPIQSNIEKTNENFSSEIPDRFTPEMLIQLIPVIVHDLRNQSVSPQEAEILSKLFGKLWPYVLQISNNSEVDIRDLFNIKSDRDLQQFLQQTLPKPNPTFSETDYADYPDDKLYDYVDDHQETFNLGEMTTKDPRNEELEKMIKRKNGEMGYKQMRSVNPAKRMIGSSTYYNHYEYPVAEMPVNNEESDYYIYEDELDPELKDAASPSVLELLHVALMHHQSRNTQLLKPSRKRLLMAESENT